MPAPDPYSTVAIAVITISPLLIVAALLYMYLQIGRTGLVGESREVGETAERA